jgi:hypothetical protein
VPGAVNAVVRVGVVPSREVADLAAAVVDDIDAAVGRLASRITTEMDPYRAGIVSTEQLRASLRQNLLYMLDHIGGGSATDLSVARETGTARGRTGAPLPELLKAYRLGFSELWRMLVEHARRRGAVSVEALIDAATDIWTLADEYSDAVTDAYREAQADTLYERARHRAALIEAVLTGQTGDHGTLWEIAERLRIPYEGEFLVVAAETSALEGSALGSAEPRLAALDVASAWRLLPGLELGLVSLGRAARAPAALEVIGGLAQGRVGISPRFTKLDNAPEATRSARIAMAAVPPGTVAVRQFDESPLGALAAAAPESSKRVARAVLGSLLELPAEERETLLGTLDAWLDCLGSATEAGRRIYVHPNTVRHRLRRIEQHTGRSMDNPRAVAELAVALSVTRLFPELTRN